MASRVRPRRDPTFPAHTRLLKDFEDLEEICQTGDLELTFPQEGNLRHFRMRITMRTGIYQNYKFDFDVSIPDDWPTERPNITLLTRTWHPNLTEDGKICLNILRKNYAPTITLASLVPSLQYLFASPNPSDPLNKDAAQQFQQNYNGFKVKAEEYCQKYCPKS